MIHFIPAWYQANGWIEKEQTWYIRRERTEFDDTVKQIQLFHRNSKLDYHIILLHFAPNFRHFLHRQGVYNAPYWSCFDAIQEIKSKRASIFSYHSLDWPDDVEFLHTPFIIAVYRHQKKYAEIYFGEDGNTIQINFFENDKLIKTNIYDDRGFLSLSTIFEDGKKKYSEYLNPDGQWKIRVNESSGTVSVNHDVPFYILDVNGEEKKVYFEYTEYKNIEDVITEIFRNYEKYLDEKDVFCVAAEDNHIAPILYALKDRKLITSFFERRYKNSIPDLTKAIVAASDYIITDSEDNIRWLRAVADLGDTPIRDITPYDSRVDQGISAQIPVQNIMVAVDGLKDDIFAEIIQKLAEYISTRDRVMIHLFTRNAQFNIKDILLEKARKALAAAGFDERLARVEGAAVTAEVNVDGEEEPDVRFFVDQCVDELSVSKVIRLQKIIVDLRDIADLYLNITGISTGIPLIVKNKTRYIYDGENGVVLDSPKDLNIYLEKYLDSLGEWNKVLVFDYNLSQKYTSKILVGIWKEIIESIE